MVEVEANGLGEILRLTVDDFWRQMKDPSLDLEAQTRRVQRLYAEAWALWHVLLNTTPDRKRAAADYVRAELKGVGLSKAKAIVEYRKKHGPFRSADDLSLVKGIGERTVELNRADIKVSAPKK